MKKKKMLLLICIISMTVLMSACVCKHEWIDATCEEPKTCGKCGKTEGEALGHTWVEATCTEAKKCSVCGKTEGEALGHTWVEATCTEAKKCSVCGQTEGEALGHQVEKWNVVKEATCSEEGEENGQCTVCGQTITQTVAKVEHKPGDWEVTKEASGNAKGERAKKCTVCGEVLETEEYELSEEEKEQAFKDSCKKYSYDEIARDPDSYYLKPCVFTGKVMQVMEDGDDSALRVNVTKTKYSYDDTIYVYYFSSVKKDNKRILEDDIITIYGYSYGLMSYESVMGAKITIPSVVAQYVEMN